MNSEPHIDTIQEEHWDTESLSDRSSVYSVISHNSHYSTTTSTATSDLSIYAEFTNAINEIDSICETQHRTLEGLHHLQTLITSNNTIFVKSDDCMIDLHTIIDQLHDNAMAAIGHNEPNRFTDQLLDWIERIPSDE